MHVWIIKADKKSVKLASFEEGHLTKIFTRNIDCDLFAFFKEISLYTQASEAFIITDDFSLRLKIEQILSTLTIPSACFDKAKITLHSDAEESDLITDQTIANGYGALSLFPTFDCIVLDIDDEIHAEIFAREGKYLGSAIYPGYSLCATSLGQTTDNALLSQLKPKTPFYSTKQSEAIHGGLYYGFLGAIERIIAEMGHHLMPRGLFKVIATGKITENEDLAKDLSELTDLIDPRLVFRGFYEIHKEQKHNFKEK